MTVEICEFWDGSWSDWPEQTVSHCRFYHTTVFSSCSISFMSLTTVYKIANKQIRKPAPMAFGMNEPCVALPS